MSLLNLFDQTLSNELNKFLDLPTTNSFPTSVRSDLIERDDAFEIHCELPGVPKEQVNLQIEDGFLTISGERSSENETNKNNYVRRERFYGSFHRSFKLPKDVVTENTSAVFQDGVLSITLPRDGSKTRVKKIDIV